VEKVRRAGVGDGRAAGRSGREEGRPGLCCHMFRSTDVLGREIRASELRSGREAAIGLRFVRICR